MLPRALRHPRALPAFAGLTVFFLVLVILEGAVVRATGSGAGCGNHWPLCNGEVLPHHPRLATIIEFTHRSLTGFSSTLVFVLAAWTFLARPKGHSARRAVVWTLALLITEALLGALLVKGGYVEHNASTARVVVQAIHFTNTMALLAAVTLAWWWLGDNRPPTPLEATSRPVAWTALLSTLLAGATGSIAALADTLFPSTSFLEGLHADLSATAPALVRIRWIHPAAACIAALCAVWFASRLRSRPARWFAVLTLAQIAFGIADVLLLAPTYIQVVHLAVADALWIALLAACSMLFARMPERIDSTAAAQQHARAEATMEAR